MDATHDHRPRGTADTAGARSLKDETAGGWLRRIGRGIEWATTAGLLALIAIYKVVVSPLLGRHCRFQPTCSTYFREAVIRYGAVRGSWRGFKRICRCHPWHPGGHDPP